VATFASCPIGEIARLGRTLRQWKTTYLGYFTTERSTNGGTEANGIIELHRRIAAATATATTTDSGCSWSQADSTTTPYRKSDESLTVAPSFIRCPRPPLPTDGYHTAIAEGDGGATVCSAPGRRIRQPVVPVRGGQSCWWDARYAARMCSACPRTRATYSAYPTLCP